MFSSQLEKCMNDGKKSFEKGMSRTVPSSIAKMEIAAFAFLKGFDEASQKCK